MPRREDPRQLSLWDIAPVGLEQFRSACRSRYPVLAGAVVRGRDVAREDLLRSVNSGAYRPATAWSAVNDNIVLELATAFTADPGVRFVERDAFGQPVFVVEECAELRVNKLDKYLRPGRQRTRQDREYREHRRLARFSNLPRVVIGYREGRAGWLDLLDITLVHWVGSRLEWHEPLPMPAALMAAPELDDEQDHRPYVFDVDAEGAADVEGGQTA